MILSKSPNADAGILNNPLPSPLNNDADTDDDTLSEPVICVLSWIAKGEIPFVPITKVSTAEALTLPTKFTDCDENDATSLPLTNNETKLELN